MGLLVLTVTADSNAATNSAADSDPRIQIAAHSCSYISSRDINVNSDGY